jgi:hypothetical protein
LAICAGQHSPSPMLLNLLTNASVEFSFTNPTMTQVRDTGFTNQSPFVATALVGEPSIWTLTDQRTMETRTLSELGGVEWPRNTPVYISENGAQGTYAIAVHDRSRSTNHQPVLLQPEGFPGELLLVSGSLDNVSWIDIPDDMTAPGSAIISPDGEHVAVLGKKRPEISDPSFISIIRASDGAEVTRTELFMLNALPNMIWINDGGTLVYAESGALMMLDTDTGSTQELLLESSGRLFALSKTYDPDVITIAESSVPIEEWRGESDRLYAVNTRTGSVETFDGLVWQPASYTGNAWGMQPVIVMIEQGEADETSTRVIDPSTGEILIDVPMAPIGAQSNSAEADWQPTDPLALSADTIRDHQTLIVANVSGDQPEGRQIAFPEFTPPDGAWSTQVRLSPDGSTVQLSVYTNLVNMQWTLDLTDTNAAWKEIPDGVWVEHMPAMP